MSGWHSLSGQLQYKSGNALGRLMSRRKVWCILEESECRLQLYKTEEDVHKRRQPHSHIDLRAAAISLDLDNQNQFVILSDKKEHMFTADNHESMMIWLLGLQAQRDLHSRKMTSMTSSSQTRSAPTAHECELWDNKPCLYMTFDQHHGDIQVSQSARSSPRLTRHGFQWAKYETKKCGDSMDSGLSSYKKGLEMSKSFPLNVNACQPFMSRKLSNSQTMLSFDSDCDDVFSRELLVFPSRVPPISPRWRKLQHAVLGHMIPNSHMNSHMTRIQGSTGSNERHSYSSRSASSDSAIERGEWTPQELNTRLGDLEKELISTKCELAKVLNRQTCYQEMLLQKDEALKDLEGQRQDNQQQHDKNRSPVKSSKAMKEFEERVRVLQNQNRFLNEEVKKLARLRLQEHGAFQEQNTRLRSLEAEIDQWKMDYVSLIQSCIRNPGDESSEDVELCLYGGDKHKNRVRGLLEEARKINPRLPTYDSLANNEVHVDVYGFKHLYTNTGLLLHYLCTELSHHYLMQAGVYEEHQKRWTSFMRQHGKNPTKSMTELKELCRGGIPDRFRKQMWRHLVRYKVSDLIKEKGEHYYRNLCNLLPESPLAACYRKQVSLDLMRTMPSNIRFSTMGSKGIMDLQDVLLAFCIHNPTIGYCQGMNFIVAMGLLILDPEDAFWLLVAIAESYFSPHYFDHSLIGAQADQQILKDLVRDKLPSLHSHLENIDIELSTVTLNWFLAVFFDAVPFQTLLRVWDCFLLEGPKVLFRFALAILRLHERDILQRSDTMGIMKHLKSCTRLTYDVEGLVKLAFDGLKPFPKRRDTISKQTCYLNALKEKYKKKELQRLAFAEREQMYMNMEAEAGCFLGIECAVTIDNGQVWFCYGDQNIGHLGCVSCDSSTMYTVNYKLDTRLMCMCPLGDDELLLGTISWLLVSVNPTNHKQRWQIQLHDAILAVCCYDDVDSGLTRIFSGLADGTVAVTEKPYTMEEPNVDVIYVSIGQAPVTCLMLLGDQLWCASGNTVAILHAKTLDAMDIFSVSVNPYDHILALCDGPFGIWISLRGSSILELWDPKTLNCRMLYDTRTDRYPQLRKEDDAYFNRARITSILSHGSTVWVGTGEGNLSVYEILESAQLKTPTERSPSVETSSSMSYVVRPNKKRGFEGRTSHGQSIEPRVRVDSCIQSSLEVQMDSLDDLDFSGCEQDEFQSNQTSSVHHARRYLRRRSSSETNLNNLHSNNSIQDSNGLDRHHSENDLDLCERLRKLSEHVSDLEEETESKMEAEARRESLSLISDAEKEHKLLQQALYKAKSSGSSRSQKDRVSSRRSSLEHQLLSQALCGSRRSSKGGNSSRRSSVELRQLSLQCKQNGLHSPSSFHSEDSGCVTMDKSRRGKNHSNQSDNSGHVRRRLFTKADTSSMEVEEDAFEARLEQKARRASLVSLGLEILAPQVAVDHGSSLCSDSDHRAKAPAEATYVSIYLDPSQDNHQENKITENTILYMNGLGINFDDDYISSSPSLSLTPIFPPHTPVSPRSPVSPLEKSILPQNTPDPPCSPVSPLKKVSPLGISIDSELDTAENPMRDFAVGMKDISIEEEEKILEVYNKGRRRSSVLEDMSLLCSECKRLETKCKDCKLLLLSQEVIKRHEKRRQSLTKSVTNSPAEIRKFGELHEEITQSLTNSPAQMRKFGDRLYNCKFNGMKNFDGDLIVHKSVDFDNMEEINGYCNNEQFRLTVGMPGRKDTKDGMQSEAVGETHASMAPRRTSFSDSELHKQINDEMFGTPYDEQVKMFPRQEYERSDLTRQEKIGYWLSSITKDSSIEHGYAVRQCGDKASKVTGYTPETTGYSPLESFRLSHNKTESPEGIQGLRQLEEEEVFQASQKSSESGHLERPSSLNLAAKLRRFYDNKRSQRSKVCMRQESGGSDGSSTQKSVKVVHLNKNDQEVQYRLEFSGVCVDTDIDSCPTQPAGSGHRMSTDSSHVAGSFDRDSRKNSLDLGAIKEKCSRLESEVKSGLGSHKSVDMAGDGSERQKMFEFLKTPSLASRQASLGLKIIDHDLEWTELYSGNITTPSPTSSTEKRFADFLRTPSISSKASSKWSSYENISTPSQPDPDRKLLYPHQPARNRRCLSHSPSDVSMGSDIDLLYNVDLNLEAKMKISDKPVKCLLATSCNNEPLILSFSGSFGDDEAVLKWKKHENEQLWTNEPILELCPRTKTAILPTYMRRRMSSNSSHNSIASGNSDMPNRK